MAALSNHYENYKVFLVMPDQYWQRPNEILEDGSPRE